MKALAIEHLTDEQMKTECIRMIAENDSYLIEPIYKALQILTGGQKEPAGGAGSLKAIIIRRLLPIESERVLSCISSFMKGITGDGNK